MRIEPAEARHAEAMASAHAQAFDQPWDEDSFEALLEGEGVFGFVALGDDPAGVILCRVAADQMEVLTLGVAPWARRQGVGQALMAAGLGAARQTGARETFLEVDVDNAAAVALYERLGFCKTGLRKAYYDRGASGYADALVMRLALTSDAR